MFFLVLQAAWNPPVIETPSLILSQFSKQRNPLQNTNKAAAVQLYKDASLQEYQLLSGVPG